MAAASMGAAELEESMVLERQRSSADAGARPARAGGALDVFDQEGFDAVAYINEMFPTESSLAGLDPLIQKLHAKIRRLDAGVIAAVRHQSTAGGRARQDLDSATASIQELFGKISDIRRKAEASEAMVQEICRDIRKLDFAKQHLTRSITALRRFAMLCNAVEQLQTAAERGEFGEAAHLVEAVQQLAAHFQGYASIPKVAELSGRVAALQTSLQFGAKREFDLLGTGEETPSEAALERLKACCALIDAIGPKAKDEVIEGVCRREIGVYTQIFSGSGDTAALERTERRFLWLRGRLQRRAALWSVFPEAWRLPQALCLRFCAATRQQLSQSLEARAADLPGSVEALLVAVKSTNDFEAEMAQRFGAARQAEAPPEEEALDDSAPASAVRQRHERLFKERRSEAGGGSPRAGAGGAPAGQAATGARDPFRGAISGVFAEHLRVYVEAEERALREQLEQLVAGESWRAMEEAQQTRVLHSASQLFGAIKRSLQRCSKHVSRREALLQLLGAFQRVLHAYAAKLLARLPKTAAGGCFATVVAGATDWQVRMGEGDVAVACLIIASAEYCAEAVAGLARSVARTLEPPFGEQVDVAVEEEQFQGVVTASLSLLVLAVQTRLDSALQQMVRLPWASLEAVGDQSEFVNAVSRALAEAGPQLAAGLSELHYRYFCDKLAASFCPAYADSIFRCKKISEAGSQQLLLDTQAIKGVLLELPAAGAPGGGEAAVPAAFLGYVSREMAKAEALLKVIGSRPDNLADNFATLMPAASPAVYQRILDLKVLKRQEQASLAEALARRPGPAQGQVLAPQLARGVTPAGVAAAAAAAQAGSQDFATRFRFSANTAAARASAAAAGERMRETMAGSFAAMKSLNIGFRSQNPNPRSS